MKAGLGGSGRVALICIPLMSDRDHFVAAPGKGPGGHHRAQVADDSDDFRSRMKLLNKD